MQAGTGGLSRIHTIVGSPLRLLFLALAMRVGFAVVDEIRPIFPSYYYADAKLADETGWEIAEQWRQGLPASFQGSPSNRLWAAGVAATYRVAGRRPLVPKILVAAFGSLSIFFFYLFMRRAFAPAVVLWSAALLTAWPSHVFFTSQNVKDGVVITLSYAAIAGLTARNRRIGLAAAAAALIAVGFFRGYLLLTISAVSAAAFLLFFAIRYFRKRHAARLLAPACAAVAAVALYFPIAKAVFEGPLAVSAATKHDPSNHLKVAPATYDDRTGKYITPYSPEGISEFRRIRQKADRDWALKRDGREIGSQLFYGARFETWLDVALFIPKSVFYVLFMPLPGFYPLGHKLGRWLSAIENVFMLGLAFAAARALILKPRHFANANRFLALALFLVMATASSLLEFDLGSASRHRILYLPFLFPFAVTWAIRAAKSRNS